MANNSEILPSGGLIFFRSRLVDEITQHGDEVVGRVTADIDAVTKRVTEDGNGGEWLDNYRNETLRRIVEVRDAIQAVGERKIERRLDGNETGGI